MKGKVLIFLHLIFLIAVAWTQGTSHVIKSGETLYSIARHYKTTVDAICQANNIEDATKVKSGQMLIIPGATDSKKPVPQYTGSTAAKEKTVTIREYTVKSGDTLYGISRKFSISVDTIRKANGMTKDDVIQVGQVLQIYSSDKFTMDDIKNNSIPAVPIKKEKPTQPTIKPTDPRSYQNKKLDDSIIWPIKAVDLSYVTGKINNVLLVAKNKETVSAIKGGLVIFSGLYRGFGQVVFVHAQNTGHIYVYSGLDTISVKKGQKVTFGDEIGTLGIDSITNKPTLNFMVFKNGEPVDPAKAPRG